MTDDNNSARLRAEMTLSLEVEVVAAAPEDAGYRLLSHAAYRMERHISKGEIDRQTVERSLITAARAAGLPYDSILRAMQTARVASI